MKSRIAFAAALVAALCVSPVHADDVTSGIEVGGKVKSYQSTKCGGGTDDGVEVGQSLCYT